MGDALLRVLLAEDEAIIALFFREELEQWGCKVTWAPNGERALSEAQTGAVFDVLVTDLKMSGLRGEDLIRQLRETRPLLPVVVVTGSPPTGGAASLSREGEGPLTLLIKPTLTSDILRAFTSMGLLGASPSLSL
ncbi:response regulator [Sabulicella glaciei]|uniref:Response regulator n=1 Tax=Sabulicella glaciei TaxID=2984948 RepID=A0ABT3NQT1_9PROT|nr:response regulator [Roseococcus sp. MDT2-1-1]MCW8084511.1 response regulator [Roseococcus sp. MDT2-1-1]